MVRTYWFLPIFYEAIGVLDLQPSARTDRVEACRPRVFLHSSVYGMAPGHRRRRTRL